MIDVVVLKGDGIGPEITDAVCKIIKASGADIEFHPYDVGSTAYEKYGALLPKEVLEAIQTYQYVLKGPITTPIGNGFRSINVELRLAFDLYANVRPAKSIPGISKFQNVNIITVRENTEDLYLGIEQEILDGFEAIKRITKAKSERIIRYAFELAQSQNRKKVTCVHKANILKKTDGLFLSTFQEIAKQYPQIEADDKIIDNMCMQLVMYPEKFDVIVAPNLYGDILSDLIAGLVGGLGLVPGANLSDTVKIYEAVHGSAPDIAGLGIANPMALLEAALMLLQELGQIQSAQNIRQALDIVLEKKEVLPKDLGGSANTLEFVNEILKYL